VGAEAGRAVLSSSFVSRVVLALVIESLVCSFLGVGEGVGESFFLRVVLTLGRDVRAGRLAGAGTGKGVGEEYGEEDGEEEIDSGCLGVDAGLEGLDDSLTFLFSTLV